MFWKKKSIEPTISETIFIPFRTEEIEGRIKTELKNSLGGFYFLYKFKIKLSNIKESIQHYEDSFGKSQYKYYISTDVEIIINNPVGETMEIVNMRIDSKECVRKIANSCIVHVKDDLVKHIWNKSVLNNY